MSRLALAGSFYLETPGMFGGDVRARGVSPEGAHARSTLHARPHRAGPLFIEQSRYDEAREQLKQVIDERRPSYKADWVARHRPTAERLLAEIRTR